ncbi:hypothetical protein [Streptomyces sp. 4R-3d]|uniref:hypothetical protein n=1 Tax=Streptomyces sp. 4R-3d TaxID=2559605 RepID=UPI0010720A59|nr:hypothetical protein [Streptomyces sp. 4R-3d]TFI28987.1 hypothetical protein E4P36_07905 [Streptomyces sp. 4R-3d]
MTSMGRSVAGLVDARSSRPNRLPFLGVDEKPQQQGQAAADPVGEIDWAVAADSAYAYSNGPPRQYLRAAPHGA